MTRAYASWHAGQAFGYFVSALFGALGCEHFPESRWPHMRWCLDQADGYANDALALLAGGADA